MNFNTTNLKLLGRFVGLVNLLNLVHNRPDCSKETTLQFASLIEKRISTRGSVDTIYWIKSARLHVTRYMCGHPLKIKDHPNMALDKDGFPREILYLKPLVDSRKVRNLRYVLTLLNVSRSLNGTSIPDLLPIIQENTSQSPGEIPVIAEGLALMVEKLGWRLDLKEAEDLLLTSKSGPMGQAMLSSIKELPHLTEELLTDMTTLSGPYVRNRVNLLKTHLNIDVWNETFPTKKQTTSVPTLRKLSLIHDKENKTRIIAIFDYWTQTALNPLMTSLEKLLKSIKNDGTFNQAVASNYKVCGPHYSADLTAATDRIPITIQARALQALGLTQEQVEAWTRLMIGHSFTVPFTNKQKMTQVSYSVGQPMGARSSWATMAVTHHLIVRLAAWRSGLNPKSYTDYLILGDDVVISNSAVYEEYRKIMSQLGVSISNSKSHESKDTFEFAKQWFQDGICISGASLTTPLTSTKYLELVGWVRELEHRWRVSETMVSRGWFDLLFQTLGVGRGLSARLANKSWNLWCTPLKEDSDYNREFKMRAFWNQYVNDYLGCSRPVTNDIQQVVYHWLAEAKTSTLERSIINATKASFLFFNKIKNVPGLINDEADSQSVLPLIPPIEVARNNVLSLQKEVDKLRTAFESEESPDFVFNPSIRLALDPEKLFSVRGHQLVLSSQATLSFHTRMLLRQYNIEREEMRTNDVYIEM